MNPDPVREHIDTRTEAEISWHITFLADTRQRLLRRPVTPTKPPLTPEQVDIAVLRANRELAMLALMIVEGMRPRRRARREERASKCVTSWTAALKRPSTPVRTVTA